MCYKNVTKSFSPARY